MTVNELIKVLKNCDGDKVVVCEDLCGGWDNIQKVKDDGSIIHIVFGGGSPFSADHPEAASLFCVRLNKVPVPTQKDDEYAYTASV